MVQAFVLCSAFDSHNIADILHYTDDLRIARGVRTDRTAWAITYVMTPFAIDDVLPQFYYGRA